MVSGGQTGADRAALLWALARGVACGGWCPRGRWAEDGVIPLALPLRETPSPHPEQRTEWNVRDADATVVFTAKPGARGGSLWTLVCAERLRRPCLHLHAAVAREAPRLLWQLALRESIRVLNVAGCRASEEPCLGRWVTAVLERSFVVRRKR